VVRTILKTFSERSIHVTNFTSTTMVQVMNCRLTGKHETQSIDKFSWGVSDRGASIRVPLQTSKSWKGYIEDRRPASNGDPYKIVGIISETLDFALTLDKVSHNMFAEVDTKNSLMNRAFEPVQEEYEQ